MSGQIGLAKRLALFLFMLLLPSLNYAQLAAIYQGDYKGEAAFGPLPCPLPRFLRDGLYIGIGAGHDIYKIRESTESLSSIGVLLWNPALIARGALGSMMLGYGRHFNWFYFGGEIFAEITGAMTDFTTLTTNGSYRAKIVWNSTYGVGLMPGIYFNRSSIIYGRIGYVRSFVKVHERSSVGAINTRYKKSFWENGLHYGFGLETLLINKLSLRGEYTFTAYNALTSELNNRFTPADNQFVLSLIYHFDYPGPIPFGY